MKTFALILHLFTSDGSEYLQIEDTGLTARECAAELVDYRYDQSVVAPFKGARRIVDAAVSCDEEEGV